MRVVHLDAEPAFGQTVNPDHYVVALLCGVQLWTSLEKYEHSAQAYRDSHWVFYKDNGILDSRDLTSDHAKITCLCCLALIGAR
jgi:hypothetical protein